MWRKITEAREGGSDTIPLTSCLTVLDKSVLQIKTKIVSIHTADSKPVKQEVNGTVILPLWYSLLKPSLLIGANALKHDFFIADCGYKLKRWSLLNIFQPSIIFSCKPGCLCTTRTHLGTNIGLGWKACHGRLSTIYYFAEISQSLKSFITLTARWQEVDMG